jgi:hypothetical protein
MMPVNPFKFLDAQGGKIDLSRFDLNTNKTLDANESTPEWLAALNGLTADPNGDAASPTTDTSKAKGDGSGPSVDEQLKSDKDIKDQSKKVADSAVDRDESLAVDNTRKTNAAAKLKMIQDENQALLQHLSANKVA